MLDIFDKIMHRIDRIVFENENTSSLEFKIGILEKKTSFYDSDIKKKINKAFNYIIDSKLKFEDLEVVFYGMMNKLYLSDIDTEINLLKKLYIDIENYIDKISVESKKKKYLIILN